MASVVLSGDTSGTITISAPAVSGSTTQTLVAATGTLAPLISGTAVASTSGTAINFDNAIPSWAKRVIVMFQGVSTNGTGIIQVQLGTGSTPTYTITGYLGGATSVQTSTASAVSYTTGFALVPQQAAAAVHHGVMTISLVNASTNAWAASSTSSRSDLSQSGSSAGSIALAAALTSVRVIGSATGSPSDTFDAGSINILYE
jgi:hypothetical protein